VDIVQTAGICSIALILAIVVLRLDHTVHRAADQLKKLLRNQQSIQVALDVTIRRLDELEQKRPLQDIHTRLEELERKGKSNQK
jgi:hypothetical protein